MGDFRRDDRRGGRREFGKRSFGDRYKERQMFKTVCSKCQKECEVPFQPTGAKPVFCRECFRNEGGSRPNFDNRNNSEVRPFQQPQYKEQFEALNIKLDKILKILTPEQAPVFVAEKKKRVSKKAPKIAETS